MTFDLWQLLAGTGLGVILGALLPTYIADAQDAYQKRKATKKPAPTIEDIIAWQTEADDRPECCSCAKSLYPGHLRVDLHCPHHAPPQKDQQ